MSQRRKNTAGDAQFYKLFYLEDIFMSSAQIGVSFVGFLHLLFSDDFDLSWPPWPIFVSSDWSRELMPPKYTVWQMGQDRLLCPWAQPHTPEVTIKLVANRTLILSVFSNDWQLQIFSSKTLEKWHRHSLCQHRRCPVQGLEEQTAVRSGTRSRGASARQVETFILQTNRTFTQHQCYCLAREGSCGQGKSGCVKG